LAAAAAFNPVRKDLIARCGIRGSGNLQNVISVPMLHIGVSRAVLMDIKLAWKPAR
jgi:hypothetical protein